MKIDVNAAWVALICAAVFFWALFSEEPQSVATTPTPTMDKVRGEFDKQLDSILAQVKANNSQLQELRDEVREALKANSGGEVIDPPPAPVVRVTCDNPDCPCENCTCEAQLPRAIVQGSPHRSSDNSRDEP